MTTLACVSGILLDLPLPPSDVTWSEGQVTSVTWPIAAFDVSP